MRPPTDTPSLRWSSFPSSDLMVTHQLLQYCGDKKKYVPALYWHWMDSSELDQKMDLVEVVLGAWMTRFRWRERFYRKLYTLVAKAAFVVITRKDEEDLLGSSKIKPLPPSLWTCILKREVSRMNHFRINLPSSQCNGPSPLTLTWLQTSKPGTHFTILQS